MLGNNIHTLAYIKVYHCILSCIQQQYAETVKCFSENKHWIKYNLHTDRRLMNKITEID